MTSERLYVAVGLPILFNAILIGLVLAHSNAKADGLRDRMNHRFNDMYQVFNQRFEGISQCFEGINQRFEGINQRFDAIDRRFDDMRDFVAGRASAR